jgi:hypothetical protein
MLSSLIFAAGFSAPIAGAQQNAPDPNASEELSRQTLGDIEALIAQVQGKLNSSKPMTPKDLDAVFNDKFFSGTGDPFAKLEQVQKQMSGLQGPGKGKFDDLYQAWASERLDTQDLEPETREEGSQVIVDFKAPEGSGSSLDLNINKNRIKMNYAVKDIREHKRADGTTYTTSFFKRNSKIMSLPKGVNPARYKVEKSDRGVRVIFQKARTANKAEASK